MILGPETIGWLGTRALELLHLLPELAPPTANISGSSWADSWTFHDFLNPFPLISGIVSWFLKFLTSVCLLFNSSACYLDTIKAIFAKSHHFEQEQSLSTCTCLSLHLSALCNTCHGPFLAISNVVLLSPVTRILSTMQNHSLPSPPVRHLWFSRHH